MLFPPSENSLHDVSRMGFRSLFVLMKLAFDMRDQYDELIDQPLPEEIVRPLQVMTSRGR